MPHPNLVDVPVPNLDIDCRSLERAPVQSRDFDICIGTHKNENVILNYYPNLYKAISEYHALQHIKGEGVSVINSLGIYYRYNKAFLVSEIFENYVDWLRQEDVKYKMFSISSQFLNENLLYWSCGNASMTFM